MSWGGGCSPPSPVTRLRDRVRAFYPGHRPFRARLCLVSPPPTFMRGSQPSAFRTSERLLGNRVFKNITKVNRGHQGGTRFNTRALVSRGSGDADTRRGAPVCGLGEGGVPSPGRGASGGGGPSHPGSRPPFQNSGDKCASGPGIRTRRAAGDQGQHFVTAKAAGGNAP